MLSQDRTIMFVFGDIVTAEQFKLIEQYNQRNGLGLPRSKNPVPYQTVISPLHKGEEIVNLVARVANDYPDSFDRDYLVVLPKNHVEAALLITTLSGLCKRLPIVVDFHEGGVTLHDLNNVRAVGAQIPVQGFS